MVNLARASMLSFTPEEQARLGPPPSLLFDKSQKPNKDPDSIAVRGMWVDPLFCYRSLSENNCNTGTDSSWDFTAFRSQDLSSRAKWKRFQAEKVEKGRRGD